MIYLAIFHKYSKIYNHPFQSQTNQWNNITKFDNFSRIPSGKAYTAQPQKHKKKKLASANILGRQSSTPL